MTPISSETALVAAMNGYPAMSQWRWVDGYFTTVANPALEATALQMVGVKGWDGLILVRRR